MAESPPKTGAIPTKGDPVDEPLMKKGDSDPLFNPPGLKARKTSMGLAPAPHLGGAKTDAVDAEARRQRVLARIAGLDTKPPPKTPSTAPTTPPRPGSDGPAQARSPTTPGVAPQGRL